MSYALQAFGALPIDVLPAEERNGLLWIKEPMRAGLIEYIGSSTEFHGTEEGAAIYGTAYVSVVKQQVNWVSTELAKGRAVAIRPANSAMPAVAAYTTADPYELAYNTAKSFGGTYAILAAPASLVTAAAALAAKGPTKTTPGSSLPTTPIVAAPTPVQQSGDSAPKWLVPVLIGTAVVAGIALLK